jgi:excisionase family DNA binding protein
MGSDSTPTLALRPPEAAKALGISESLLGRLTARGEVRAVKVSRKCTLYRPADLERWLTERSSEQRGVPA